MGPISLSKIPSALILINADKMLSDLLCCSYKTHSCLCTCPGKQIILLVTFLIGLSEMCLKFSWNVLD